MSNAATFNIYKLVSSNNNNSTNKQVTRPPLIVKTFHAISDEARDEIKKNDEKYKKFSDYYWRHYVTVLESVENM